MFTFLPTDPPPSASPAPEGPPILPPERGRAPTPISPSDYVKKIYLDVDEVILSYAARFATWINLKFDLGNRYSRQNPVSRDSGRFGEERFNDLNREFIGSDAMRDFPPLIDPAEFNAFSAEYPVSLVTNLPEDSIPNRVENLAELGFKYDRIFCGGFIKYDDPGMPLKSDVINSQLGGDDRAYFLDDLPDNCEDVKANVPNAEAFLMSAPFNENLPDQTEYWKRVRKFKDFCGIVRGS